MFIHQYMVKHICLKYMVNTTQSHVSVL